MQISEKEILSNNVYKLRRERKITQCELAAAIGVSRQTIFLLEKMRYFPSLIIAYRIAKLFEVDITQVFIYKNCE